ncbi:SDR family NAD(P)-dependent oxidoreductase [Burkholderia gladioli]|uniref:SDR family NAD(P)-dependent oxidoreductase n=1 Tax=Burkholderia gladioli TaxID=28095 RepID=UPI003D21E778
MSASNSKVVLVTGASRGIGAATARLLARARLGRRHQLRARRRAAAEALADELRAGGARVTTVRGDVAVEAEVDRPCSITSSANSARSTRWSTTPASSPRRSRSPRWS